LTQLLITQTAPGVATVTSTDPFSSLELYRIDREAWHATPAVPGIYLLYGFVDNEPVVYVGMSTPLARVYKGAAEKVAPRDDSDPPQATHRFAGKTVRAWGSFEALEPDTRFRVLAGSGWRPAVVDPSQTVFKQQKRVASAG